MRIKIVTGCSCCRPDGVRACQLISVSSFARKPRSATIRGLFAPVEMATPQWVKDSMALVVPAGPTLHRDATHATEAADSNARQTLRFGGNSFLQFGSAGSAGAAHLAIHDPVRAGTAVARPASATVFNSSVSVIEQLVVSFRCVAEAGVTLNTPVVGLSYVLNLESRVSATEADSSSHNETITFSLGLDLSRRLAVRSIRDTPPRRFTARLGSVDYRQQINPSSHGWRAVRQKSGFTGTENFGPIGPGQTLFPAFDIDLTVSEG